MPKTVAPKLRTRYVCSNCGGAQMRWTGKCPDCGEWNTLVEEVVDESRDKGRHEGRAMGSIAPQKLSAIQSDDFQRLPLGIEEFARVLGGGIVPGSLVLVGGDPGIGKCVTGDTRVLDPASGAYVPITEWARRMRPVLSINNSTQRLEQSNVAAYFERGVRQVVEVRTTLGRTLRCTSEHPVFTPKGWQPVAQLTTGDSIGSPRSLPYFGGQPMPEAHVKLIAYLLSDGSAQSAISVTNALPEVAEDVDDIAAAFGMLVRRYPKPNNKAVQFRFVSGVPSFELRQPAVNARDRAEAVTPMARFVTDIGLRYARPADKFVPPAVFMLPREQMALFLNRLFTCDGSVYVNAHGQPGVSYSTISRRLAEDVQHLLLRFGLVVTLRTKRHRVNDKPYTAYEIVLLGVEETQAFLREIGILGRENAREQIAGMASAQRSSTRRDMVPTGDAFWTHLRAVIGETPVAHVAENAGVTLKDRRQERPLTRYTVQALADVAADSKLQALAYGDVYWDTVVSVTPCGEEAVYDISVPGSASFVANDLIIHNSTLLMQAAVSTAQNVGPTLYVSGEESAQQLKMRAQRLGVGESDLFLLTDTNLDNAVYQIEAMRPKLTIIDSIQTMYLDTVSSSPGTVSQVRECALRLQALAKSQNIAVFIVGHVTKEGAIAGPKVLEHIVDTVLQMEGDRFHAFRLLRSIKNRFGATSEVGVFEMAGSGMIEVTNPSEAFLSERMSFAPGSAVAVTMEGTRPLLVELQALTSPTQNPMPRRTANGWDYNRLFLILAVLAKRVGIRLHDQDVFVNVVGGMTIEEPAADLPAAIAIASAQKGVPVPMDLAIIGEIGLSGELRSVGQLSARLNEAAKLGFKRCLIPRLSRPIERPPAGLQILSARSLGEALDLALGPASES